ncbi:hypothetical protein D1007_25491 [Hordeum vulgare]|nr:hypothetical protein D1007_25491 [Hordeum vulgare]KAI4972077.1 hypothetical protein ZWY2020_003002 [Hordeum vulgare]
MVVPNQESPPQGTITASIIAEELLDFIDKVRDESFSWVVREVSPRVFSVPYPSEEMLCFCTHFEKIQLRLHKFWVSVREASEVPEPEISLSRVWVSIVGLSSEARLDFILKMVSEPIGKMVAVDVGLLEGEGPARIRVLCIDPTQIDALVLPFYLDTTGLRLTYRLDTEDSDMVFEGAPPRPPSPPTPHLDPCADPKGSNSSRGSS